MNRFNHIAARLADKGFKTEAVVANLFAHPRSNAGAISQIMQLAQRDGDTAIANNVFASFGPVALVKQAKKSRKVATVAVFRDNENKLEVLLERRGLNPQAHEWSLPGGHLDKQDGQKEDYVQAAVRELEEETAISVSPEELLFVTDIERDTGRSSNDVLYVVKLPMERTTAVAGSDAEKVKWVAIDAIPDMVFDHNLFVELALKRMSDPVPTQVDLISHLPAKTNRGFLIVFEGIDGAGKSSQTEKLVEHLEDLGHVVAQTRWSASDLVGEALKRGKKKRLLSPTTYSLLHAADMVNRYEQEILPALAADKIVICDRYVYTSFVRDTLRGVDPQFLNLIYDGFREPDLTLYCRVPLEEAFERLNHKGLSYYGGGLDMHLRTDDELCCQEYQRLMHEQYERILPTVANCLYVNTDSAIEVVAKAVCAVVDKYLKNRTTKIVIPDNRKGEAMLPEIQVIKSGLSAVAADSGETVTTTPQTTVTEDAPLLPYKDISRKPTGLELGDYSLKPIGDLRRFKPILDKLQKAKPKVAELEKDFTTLKAEVVERIEAIKKKEGYEELNKEIGDLTARAANEVQRELNDILASIGESKKILIQYDNKVWGLYDEIKTTSTSDKERLEILQQSMAKLLSPELVKSVTDLADQAVAQTNQAKTEIKKQFTSWPVSKTLLKDVKEVLPKKVESLQVQAKGIKEFFTGLWQSFKNLFAPVTDTLAELQSVLETQVQPLLAEATTAGKKAGFSDAQLEDDLLPGFTIGNLVDTVTSNYPTRNEAAVLQAFEEMLTSAVTDARYILGTTMDMILKEVNPKG